MTVAEFLNHLFASYDLVDADKISKEEQKVTLMVWNLNNPPVIFYNTVKELVVLSKVGNVTKTQDLIFNIGMEMIWTAQDFEIGISEWLECPVVEHTWQNFKLHLKATHTDLKLICWPTLRNTAFYQANQMEDELITNFESVRDEVLSGVHYLVEGQYEAPQVKAFQEDTKTNNSTIVLNYLFLILIQYLRQQVDPVIT